ncbi:MAG: NAD(P)/FAD-dependent oxidoreductase [Candidatus Omnitrophota bacterium]
MNYYDAAIIGAGPAGLATSMELASKGWKVVLIEKSSFPRDKVCGGFIGPENRSIFVRYGILDEIMEKGALEVTHVHLSASNGQFIRVPLLTDSNSHSGLGFSRKSLDDIMVQKAKSLGVIFEDACVAKNIVHTPQMCQLTLTKSKAAIQNDIKVRHLIYANGGIPETGLQNSPSRLFGVFGLFDSCQNMGSDVIMHFIDRGHVGINRFENNAVNVCYVIKGSLFKQLKGKYENIWSHLLSSNPCLSRQMGSSRLLSPWKGIFVDMNRRSRFFDGNAFYVGDAAALIHPVAGGGISLALNSGILLGGLLGSTRPGEVDRSSVARVYEKTFKRRFAWPIRLSKMIGSIGHDKNASNMIIRVLKWREKNINSLFNTFHQSSAFTSQRSPYGFR